MAFPVAGTCAPLLYFASFRAARMEAAINARACDLHPFANGVQQGLTELGGALGVTAAAESLAQCALELCLACGRSGDLWQ